MLSNATRCIATRFVGQSPFAKPQQDPLQHKTQCRVGQCGAPEPGTLANRLMMPAHFHRKEDVQHVWRNYSYHLLCHIQQEDLRRPRRLLYKPLSYQEAAAEKEQKRLHKLVLPILEKCALAHVPGTSSS